MSDRNSHREISSLGYDGFARFRGLAWFLASVARREERATAVGEKGNERRRRGRLEGEEGKEDATVVGEEGKATQREIAVEERKRGWRPRQWEKKRKKGEKKREEGLRLWEKKGKVEGRKRR
ncbi:hypothetical protein B296_00018785 [Ensete ventricosum]|uniref:Uncharacterized protein n=1 Tax=Ensete ventricosum TaxID=4639 RepID=A0A426ZYY4_ENSVE|nr:hypothetical protein B296_00018785 [Ensete ventricosum]